MKLFRKLCPRSVRGLISLAVMLGSCALLFPLPVAPLPQSASEKDLSEPFPCQDRPCGCRSAEQCWKKCCCFNNAQKVAWAKANNAKVPEFVLAAAKLERGHSCEICSRSEPGKLLASGSSGSCSVCKEKSAVEAKNSCCDKAETLVAAQSHSCGSCSQSTKQSTDSRRKPVTTKWVMAVYAAECQGQGLIAFCFPISIIPDRSVLVTPSVELIEALPVESERLQQASLRPPLPPPKIV